MRQFLRGLGFLLIVVATILLSLMMASHLPFAAEESRVARLAERDPVPAWRAFHVVLEGCRCSDALRAHLASRTLPGYRETILVLGRDLEPEAAWARYGLQGVPWLVLIDPQGRVRYSGGYTASPGDPSYQDQSLAREVQGGQLRSPLPAFGCPTQEDVRRKVKLPSWIR